MASEKNIELMKKLMALAERGVGGEKETTKRKLAQLMDKYGVSDADLSDEALEDHEYKYRDQNEKKLLRQIFYKINHERDVLIYRRGKRDAQHPDLPGDEGRSDSGRDRI